MAPKHTNPMLRQVQAQKQQFKVLPQQIQLLKIFHLTTVELQQRIQQELNENPILEENSISDELDESEKDTIQDYQDEEEYQYDDIPDYKLEHNNYLSDQNLPNLPFAERSDFRQDLKEQINFIQLTEKDQEIAFYLIDSLNNSGLLEQTLEGISDDYSFKKHRIVEHAEVERIRTLLKGLEPGGVGCFTAKEFLLFQLNKMNVEEIKVIQAIQLIELHFDTLAFRNSEKVMNSLRIDSIALNLVLELIRTCRLKPITELDMEEKNDTVIPDFTIRKEGEHYEVSLCRQRSATLFVNTRMIQQLKTQNQVDKDTLYYLRNKVNSAQWFVDAIKQREHTMQKVMRVIVELQAGYFNNGDIAFLKPMILQNIADKAHVDISTISRITCNKYADTHFGVIKLKDLFSEGLETALGETISNRVIRHEIEELVKREDQTRPFTDQQIVTALSKRGFVLARRTIAKYREQSRIPAFQLRSLRLS